MNEDRSTVAVQRYLDELGHAGSDCRVEPIIRALLGRAVHRLERLCGHLLFHNYRRLTRPPLNLQPEEMLNLMVEWLLKAMREYRPQTVRQFFALANQHMLSDRYRTAPRSVVVLYANEVDAQPRVSKGRSLCAFQHK